MEHDALFGLLTRLLSAGVDYPHLGSLEQTPLRRGFYFFFALSTRFLNAFFKYLPVWVSVFATSSGVPFATTLPPPTPPSGPTSSTWSVHLIKSRLCSMVTTLFPCST